MTDYDSFAAAYARANDTNLLNAYYARPAMVDLAGDVDGRDVLDAGCGSGSLAAALVAKGALVSGFDLSPAMLAIACDRLGPEVDLRVADLAQPLPYAAAAFDVCVASLALHYLADWDGPLRELRRVLRPGGRLVVSVPHPAAYLVNYLDRDYFALTEYSETFDFAGQEGTLTAGSPRGIPRIPHW